MGKSAASKKFFRGERRTSTRPQEGQCRSVIQCGKCDAIRSINLAILGPRKSRLASHWGSYANATFLASGQQGKLPLTGPVGNQGLAQFLTF